MSAAVASPRSVKLADKLAGILGHQVDWEELSQVASLIVEAEEIELRQRQAKPHSTDPAEKSQFNQDAERHAEVLVACHELAQRLDLDIGCRQGDTAVGEPPVIREFRRGVRDGSAVRILGGILAIGCMAQAEIPSELEIFVGGDCEVKSWELQEIEDE